jgi:ATP-dependent Clp protease protease subunit
MATLKIYNDIVGEEEKIQLQMWEGIDGVCYKDIDEFISAMDKNDDAIDIRIHCRGGDCVEGWAIYDKLRRSGKKITCTVEGECSSMATIILLAAPLERRFAYKNAHFCIHNPALAYPDLDYYTRLTADNLEKNVDQLKTQVASLRDEETKMLNLYVNRTTATRSELSDLMALDTYIGTDKAIELGFITKCLSPLTASKTRTFNIFKTNTKMNKKKVSVERSVLKRLLAKAGLKKMSDLKMKALVVTAADGTELTVEREEGDPQVGDLASPDGTFVLDDGTEIVVEDGVITEINGAEGGDVTAEGLDEEELIEQVEELQTANDELTEQVEELEEQIEALKGSRVLSSDEKVILAKVNKAGGRAWLDRVLASRSSFNASNTRFVEGGQARNRNSRESATQKALRERREAAAAKRAARNK